MKKILKILKNETVLTVSWVLAAISAIFVVPDKGYIKYIDWRSLGILWGLMVIMKGLQKNGLFEKMGMLLLSKTKKIWQLCGVLILLCFFSSMLITNDVALITFVPFAIMILKQCNRDDILIPVVVFQTIAANLGSMLTPVGNPQNLYLYSISGMGIADFILWMLPCTAISFVLLLASMLFIKEKNASVIISQNESTKEAGNNRVSRISVYVILFFLALLVVARIIPYYIVLVGAVFVAVLFIEPDVLRKADYGLLATFIGFFIFTGNMGRIEAVSKLLASMVNGHELMAGIAVSQCISNVPAALLLSGFTDNVRALLYGVNIGGLGTLIASMASLISFKLFVNEYNTLKGKYFRYFTVANGVYLVILALGAIIIL